MLAAVLERHVGFLAAREGELLAAALADPSGGLPPVIEAIVRPAVNLAGSDWRGRCCLLIIAELAGEEPRDLAPEVAAALARTGGHAVYEALADRMPHMPESVRLERLALITAFVLRSVADRVRPLGRRRTAGRSSTTTTSSPTSSSWSPPPLPRPLT